MTIRDCESFLFLLSERAQNSSQVRSRGEQKSPCIHLSLDKNTKQTTGREREVDYNVFEEGLFEQWKMLFMFA